MAAGAPSSCRTPGGNMRWSDRVGLQAPISRFFLVVGLIVQASFLAVSPAQAEDADELIHKGIELRKQGKDQEALEAFQRANSLASTPRTLAQMGFAEQALGRWVDANDHLEAAQRAAADPWIAKNRGVLDSSLATIRKHLGEIEILGEPKGAEVRVDGRSQGTLPLAGRIRAAAGTVSVEVRAQGFLPVIRPVVITAEELVRETIVLQPLTSAAGGPVAMATEPAPAGEADHAPSPNADTSRRWARPLAWAGVAGAGLFAIAGGVALAVRESKAQWFSDAAHNCDENTPDRGGSACKDAYDTGHTATSLAVGSFVAAGVLGIGSAILFYTSGSSSDGSRASTVGLVCAPAGAGVGVACATRF